MDNQKLIETFYTSFANGDAEGMIACYHPEVEFRDPAFGLLKGDEARSMWRMLLERAGGNIKISFSQIKAEGEKGSAYWEAEYEFSQTKRRVLNKINAQFEFKEGKIYRHHDHFDIWKWSSQALGTPGYLLGWTPLIKNKIRQNALASLKKYMAAKVK